MDRIPLTIPSWATELVNVYESSSSNQFILYGNVGDRFLIPDNNGYLLGELKDFLLNVLLPGFDVVLSYDLGNGLRAEKGGDMFSRWPSYKQFEALPKNPLRSLELVSHYFRYCANLSAVKQSAPQVAWGIS